GRLCPRPARGLGLIRNSPAGIDARLTRRADENPGRAISSRSLLSAFLDARLWSRRAVPFMLGDTLVRRGRYGVLASSPALGLVISALKLILALFEACLIPELMLRRGCGSFAGIGAMAGVASAISEPSAPVRLSSVLLVNVL